MDQENKITFYELFAHNLTVSVRVFWSNDESSDSMKVEQMKWLNEIMHRVTSKIRSERLGLREWPEEQFIKMVRKYIDNCPSIAADIAWCINRAYESIRESKS